MACDSNYVYVRLKDSLMGLYYTISQELFTKQVWE